jgi:hypothetical protein
VATGGTVTVDEGARLQFADRLIVEADGITTIEGPGVTLLQQNDDSSLSVFRAAIGLRN